jgi:predicted alpha/beta-hydrolase family hydrolase
VGALLITPGAGSTRDHASLVAIDERLSSRGWTVERHDLVDAAAAAVAAAGCAPGDLVLGGRSMGGRMCSVAVAEGLEARALVLVCYPLHPPGRADRLRSGHFGALRLPCLFVSGTKDQFGTPAELEAATAAIPGPVTHVWIEGADHSLRRRDDQVADTVVDWLTALPPTGPPRRRRAQS